MKKSLTLAMALALGVTASAYAANPFSDVPQGHWAYASVAQLAADGVIDDEELKDFVHIQQELERISITVETLQLWSEQMLATGKINMEQYNALTGK